MKCHFTRCSESYGTAILAFCFSSESCQQRRSRLNQLHARFLFLPSWATCSADSPESSIQRFPIQPTESADSVNFDQAMPQSIIPIKTNAADVIQNRIFKNSKVSVISAVRRGWAEPVGFADSCSQFAEATQYRSNPRHKQDGKTITLEPDDGSGG